MTSSSKITTNILTRTFHSLFRSSSPSSPSPLRTLLPYLFLTSLIPYTLLLPNIFIETDDPTLSRISGLFWIFYFPLSVLINSKLLLPFFVRRNVVTPKPSEGWYQAHTLCRVAEFDGLGIGQVMFFGGGGDGWLALSMAPVVVVLTAILCLATIAPLEEGSKRGRAAEEERLLAEEEELVGDEAEGVASRYR